MRLIDADQFIKEMEELYRNVGWDEREVHFSLSDLKCNVDYQPTVMPNYEYEIARYCLDRLSKAIDESILHGVRKEE